MKPGFHPNIDSRAYFAECCPEPALTSGGIKTLTYRTAAEFAYEHPKLNPEGDFAESTAVQRFGDVAHQIALGKGRGYAIGGFDAWRSNKAKAFKEAAELKGLIPIKRAEYDAAVNAAEIMRQRIEQTLATIAGGECPPYETEVVFTWQEETANGPIWCRAMADVWAPSIATILDPKFSERMGPGTFERHAVAMGWDLQSAWYRRGVERLMPELAGRTRFVNLVVSPKPPHVSRALEADEATSHSCALMIDKAAEKFAACLRRNEWPGWSQSIESWTASSWTLAERGASAMMEGSDD